MKKLFIAPVLLAGLFLLPASAQGANSICPQLRAEVKSYAQDLAAAQAELSQIKVRLVSERQYARKLTNEYLRARENFEVAYREAKQPFSEKSILFGPNERRKLNRLNKITKVARSKSLNQGRVVKSFERKARKLGPQVKSLQRAYKVAKRNLKRNNC